jgi:hypothetical protein
LLIFQRAQETKIITRVIMCVCVRPVSKIRCFSRAVVALPENDLALCTHKYFSVEKFFFLMCQQSCAEGKIIFKTCLCIQAEQNY